MDTIFAVSSGRPPAAIAVLRVSGVEALVVAGAIAGSLPAPRQASLRALRNPVTGDLLDRALVLVFPGPNSATGEDLVEFHLHGGRAVVAAVEDCLRQLGLREAEPGEFTRRALASGRIDLTQAEGLGDLLSAETEMQRQAALMAAEGGIRRAVEQWRQEILSLAAQVEALLDHADEDDVAGSADDVVSALHDGLNAVAGGIAAWVATPTVERLRDGIRVVLAGPPNAGKSTLLNALVQRDAAIVSPIAGTTRDRIEAAVTHGGLAYLFVDTAGLAEATTDAIEAIGIARAHDAIAASDILLWLGDAPPPAHPAAVVLHPRADLADRIPTPPGRLAVSAATGQGLDELWKRLAEHAVTLVPQLDRAALNARQRALAADVLDAIQSAALHHDLLLVAEDLRLARQALDRMTGRADVESMLDSLFARFCIGK